MLRSRFVVRFGLFAACFSCSSLLFAPARATELDAPLSDYRMPEPAPVEPAPQRQRRFDAAPFELSLELGLGTPVGLLGVVAEYNLLDELALGAGLGLNDHGPIWAVRARARPLIGVSRAGTLHALFVEAAFSRGQYAGMPSLGLSAMCEGNPDDPDSPCYSVRVVPEAVSWAQFELGWEARFTSHLTLRTALGVARALNQPSWRCEHDGPVSCDGEESPARTLFVQSFALGWAF